jgi:hypothetical protein
VSKMQRYEGHSLPTRAVRVYQLASDMNLD